MLVNEGSFLMWYVMALYRYILRLVFTYTIYTRMHILWHLISNPPPFIILQVDNMLLCKLSKFALIGFMVFNTTFNNISVISWRSVLLGEETTDLSQVTDKLYHILLYTSPWSRFELTTSMVIGTDCIGNYKSNYHTITTTTEFALTIFPTSIYYFQVYIYIYIYILFCLCCIVMFRRSVTH
jgi:hypothetical protein